MSTRFEVLKSSQLDAELLDKEILSTFQEQFQQTVQLVKGNWTNKFDLEITCALELIAYWVGFYSHGSSYGCQLQNLKYRDESHHRGKMELSVIDSPVRPLQRRLHLLLNVFGKWGWLRFCRLITLQEWSQHPESSFRYRLWRAVQRIETAWKSAELVNFLMFLYDGKYRSLIDRMLQMRLVYTRREMARLISFEFMNRQLVWTAFTEFLLFLVPLINLEKMKNRVLRLVVRGQQTSDLMQLPQHICVICHSNQSSSSTTAGDDASMGGGSIDIGVGGGGDVASCTIHIPYITNCGHVYCYYCLRSNMLSDADYECLRCGTTITRISPYSKVVNDDQ